MPLLQWQLYPLEIIHSSDRCTVHTFIDFSYLPSPSLPLSLSSPSSSKCPHHYLSEESLHLIRSSDRRPPPRLDFIIGRHCTALHTCFLPSHSASTTSTALSSATVYPYDVSTIQCLLHSFIIPTAACSYCAILQSLCTNVTLIRLCHTLPILPTQAVWYFSSS